MRKGLLQKVKRKHGYTLMEVLPVVGIVAIICAIAIPSIISISRSLSFKQKNDYAKAIFMAAQANLTEMKDDSELEPLQKAIDDAAFAGMKVARIPGEDPSTTEYRYVYSKGNTQGVYNTLLPVTSVEETLRDQYVLIEFNPITGNIYSVFYAEKDIEMETLYLENEGKLPRSEEDRKKLQLGYYDGTIVSSEKMDQADVSAVVRFLNGEEGIVQVNVPAQVNTQVIMDFNRMIKGLEVDLTVMGEQGGTYESSLHGKNDGKRFQTVIENGVNYVRVEFPLDSLIDSGSFANLATETDYSQDNTKKKHLTELTAADFNGKILPGDNVSISVDVTFTPSGNDPIINIESAAIAGVNPMFHSLTENPDKGKEGEKDYILAISNARNLQNLNALAPSIADQVESVVFVENEKNEMRIDWGEVVDYYNTNYGIGTNKQYSNASAEAPARALPYFVPIQNANLFGKGTFADDATYTLQDINTSADYAAIEGNGVKVYDLQINAANLTEKPDDDAYYAISDVDYDFTGLFSYVNTSVKDINIVNPKIIGADFTYANPATGALIGAAGVSTQVTGCGVYIDTADTDFDRGLLNLSNFQGANNQYGVSGHGAVGGLVGYARSEREATNEKTGVLKDASGKVAPDMSVITFAKCFAAVPVYGEMKTSGSYGCTNGVGGLIGNSQLTNFFGCYASGNVTVKNATHGDKLTTGKIEYLGIDLPGATSWGAGGFVGTSHGTCYTNCFATGNVSGDDYGMGGFVGIMCYDSVVGTQHTVFSGCYAVGTVKAEIEVTVKVDNAETKKKQTLLESFSGGNAKHNYTLGNGETDNEKKLADYDNWETAPDYQAAYLFHNCYFLSKYRDNAPSEQDNVVSAAANDNTTELDSVDTTEVYTEKCANPALYATLGNLPETEEDGFSSGIWTKFDNTKTHPYERILEGKAYPFMALGIIDDYYGDWPTASSIIGIAYYEGYLGENNSHEYGYYYDRNSTSTLRDDEISVTDGYAILSANSSYKVKIGNKEKDITSNEQITIGENSYYVMRLSEDLMAEAAKTQKYDPDLNNYHSYYTTVTVTSSTNEVYTLYFNPNVALSQINPESGANSATKPVKTVDGKEAEVLPEEIYIRTARQLAAVADNMYYYWTEECNYVQLIDIDFEYYFQSKNVENSSSVIQPVHPIGRFISEMGSGEVASFDGTYKTVGNMQMEIKGHVPAVETNGNAGIFGVVGENATISNLIVAPDKLETDNSRTNITEIKSDTAVTNVGLLAGTNNGTIENVDILMNSGVEVKAATATNFGLLVGSNAGTVTKSDVIIGEGTETVQSLAADEPKTQITVTGDGNANVGLLIGTNSGTLSECDAVAAVYAEAQTAETGKTESAKKPATINITGTNVGLLAGKSEEGTITDCDVAPAFSVTDTAAAPYYEAQLTVNATAHMFGGLVGEMKNTNIGVRGYNSTSDDPCEINLYQVKATNAFGGLAGVSTGSTITNVEVVFGDIKNQAIVEAKLAAGLIANADSANVSDSSVDLNGIISVFAEGKNDKNETIASGLAAGVIGTANGGTISNVRFTFSEETILSKMLAESRSGTPDSHKFVIKSNALAAGFVGQLNGGTIKDCSVSGSGTIFGEVSSAGFAVQTHGDGSVEGCTVTVTAPDASKENYLMCRNDDLVIGKDTTSTLAAYPVAELSAGFIVLNGEEEQKANSGADITNCMALGSVYGTETAGFVADNRGTIRTSICSVNMASGNVFADTNSGQVENCYGWSTGGRGDEVIAEEGTTPYVSSYFAVMSPEEDEPAVVLYDADGVLSETITDYIALMSDEAMTALMGFNDNDRPQTNSPWLHSSSTMLHTYAYTMSGSYPYPMLRHHYGDWAEPFGVLYYEVYEDQSIGVKMADLAQPDTIRYTSTLTTNRIVSDAGYAVFVKKDKAGALLKDETNAVEDEPMALAEAASLYAAIGDPTGTSYALYVIEIPNGQSASTINFNHGGLTGHNVTVHPLFADTFDVVGTEQKPAIYSLRTEKQLEAAKTIPGTYLVDRTIRVSDNFVPTLTADVTIRIQDGCQIIKSDGNPVAFETPTVPDGTVSASQNMETDETVTKEP